MRKKLIGIGAVVLVLVLMLTMAPACGNGEEEGESKTLKIGFYGPLSGPAAPWGAAHEEGAKWAADDINAAGGIKVGKDTYTVEVVSCDSKYSASGGGLCGTELVYDHDIHYIIGPISTSAYEASKPIFQDNNVFNITISPTFLGGPDNPYYINGSTHGPSWVLAFWTSCMNAHPEVQTIAALAPDTADGHTSLEGHYQAAADALGRTIVAREYYLSPGTTDFYPLLTKILAENPDAIDTGPCPPGEQALMVKQARELGFTGRFFQPNWVPIGLLIDTVGLDGMHSISTSLPDFASDAYSPQMQELARRYMEERAAPDETDMPDCVVHGYSQMMFYKKAFEQADSLDPDEVMKVFDDPDFRFERYYTPNAELGGIETFGIRRQMPHFNPYCEIVIENGEAKVMQMGGTVVNVP